MNQKIKVYIVRFLKYHYMGYLRHYYNAAIHPHPFKFIFFTILAASFIFSLAIYCSIAVVNNEFQGNPIVFYSLTTFMYLIGLATIPTIILWIQGYRHREKIKSLKAPENLPKSSGNEVWYIIIILMIIFVARNKFGW
jgi:hypothetical protein